jgi:mono/diheme cytochrome c family protein
VRCHGPTLSGDGYIKYERPKKSSLIRENRRVGWDTDPGGKAAAYFEAVSTGQKVIGDPSMPVFSEKLSRQQIWQVIAYVRSKQIEADQQ